MDRIAVIDVAELQSEFDRLAAVEGLEALDHTDVYYPWLLRQLPRRATRLAEVGCGSGALTSLLAPLADQILAIDFSPTMLHLARARCAPWTHVAFEQRDASAWEPEPQSFDAIVSAATLHHLDARVVLPRSAAALRPGGTLLVHDVLRRSSVLHLPLNAGAVLSGAWLRWRRTGRFREDPRLRDAWRAHERFDRLPTITQARRMAHECLPRSRVRHHLFWRYSIQYPAASG